MENDVITIDTRRAFCVIDKCTLQALRNNDGCDWTEEEVTDLMKYFGDEEPVMNPHKDALFYAGVLILKNCQLNFHAIRSLKEIKWAIDGKF